VTELYRYAKLQSFVLGLLAASVACVSGSTFDESVAVSKNRGMVEVGTA